MTDVSENLAGLHLGADSPTQSTHGVVPNSRREEHGCGL